jgi:hypothetical protein
MDGCSGRKSEGNGDWKFEAKVPAFRTVEGSRIRGQGL